MRTSPRRDCGSITGATCHTVPAKLRSEPTGVTLRRHADMDEGEILLRQLRAHFHLAALGKAEQRARARADDLADLDVAGEDQAGGRRDDVEPADLARGSRRAAPGPRGPAHRRRRGSPSWNRSRPWTRSRGPGARGRARNWTGRARHWRAPLRPARRAAPPAAPGPSGRRSPAPGRRAPSCRHRPARGRRGRPEPAMPTGWSRLAASGPLAVIIRADLAAAGDDRR